MSRAGVETGRAKISILFGAIVFFCCTAMMCPPPPLDVDVLVEELDHPWDIAFAPDETMLFTERAGRINAFVGGTVVMLAAPADVVLGHEGGMLGLAIDPDFAQNRRIYTCFSSALSALGPDVRVVRWEVDPAYSMLVNRQDIVTEIPYGNPRRSGCRLRFGPDGFLWITTGESYPGTNSQDPFSLGGKVLRVDTDGNGAPGNPGGALREEIYSYGHRNPQGLAFRPSDGTPFSVEHGPSWDDEINRLVQGGNYGWDPVPGYNPNVPMTDLVKFPDAIPAVWSSGSPTIAPSGADFVRGAQWGMWDGSLAVAVLKGRELRFFQLNQAGTGVVFFSIALKDFGERLRVPVQGPDGSLYIATDVGEPGGQVLRVTPRISPWSPFYWLRPFVQG
jgi:glucose/arabinose dehydrogenase